MAQRLVVLAALAFAAADARVASSRASRAVVAVDGKSWRSQMTFTDRMAAGSGARAVAQTCLHPIDVMRTRLQAKGITSALTPRTFLKGITPQFALAIPAGALQFTCYEWAKERFARRHMTGALPEMSCGAFGALGASLVLVPKEVLKQRVQADVYPNVVAGVRTLMRTEGPRGLYRGYFATISRDVPWNALSFMFFGQLKTTYESIAGRAPGNREKLALGALAGTTAAVIMTPVDVVKTRLMTGGGAGGIAGTFAAIVNEEGAAALMKGVVPRVAFLAPLAAITLSLYETFGKALVSRRLAEIPRAPPLASRRFDARAFPRDGAIKTASTPGAALDVAARDEDAAAVKLRS